MLCRSASLTCYLGTEAWASHTFRILDALQRRVSFVGLFFLAAIGRDQSQSRRWVPPSRGHWDEHQIDPPTPLPTGWSQRAKGALGKKPRGHQGPRTQNRSVPRKPLNHRPSGVVIPAPSAQLAATPRRPAPAPFTNTRWAPRGTRRTNPWTKERQPQPSPPTLRPAP